MSNVRAVPRVLLVDDDPVVRTMARMALEHHAHCRVWATDAPGCRAEEAASFRPDLLIVDLQLGNCDGLELLHALRQQPELRGKPAILCTAADEAAVRERLLGSEGVSLMHKPFMPRDLATAVRRLLVAGRP